MPRNTSWKTRSNQVALHQTARDARHRRGRKFLVSSRPDTTLFFDMSSAFHTQQPRCASLFQRVQIESNTLKRPSRCTGPSRVARPYVLVHRYEGRHAVFRQEGQQLAHILHVFHVVDASTKLEI
ncbi:unnamed protein product [Mycena citricolor]|uniref:Uncharacterized protein n=1 Tax=Mycena citricolor TaxID=2018698 RepID=A0AAD2H044_9AGAR|nr:unnamed protein product [Mycena citricolor]